MGSVQQAAKIAGRRRPHGVDGGGPADDYPAAAAGENGRTDNNDCMTGWK